MSRSRTLGDARQMRRVEALAPRDPDELHYFVRQMLGLRVPRRVVVDGHTPPFAYLCHGYFEPRERQAEPSPRRAREGPEARDAAALPAALPGALPGAGAGDCVVWASRGGGKTMLGAVATLLDLLFKPLIEVRLLAGSMDQSGRMYRYLKQLLDRPGLEGVLKSEPTQRRLELVNGARVELLCQSQASVRGHRVQKLRCDEVELFDAEIWDAAQRVVQSGRRGGLLIQASVEALSTFHQPYGLMSRLVGEAEGRGAPAERRGRGDEAAAPGARPAAGFRTLFRWCALDVAEPCPLSRPCKGCRIEADCRGRAREAEGFYSIADLLDARARSSDRSWASEMLCRQPSVQATVYPNFDPRRHASAAEGPAAPPRRAEAAGLRSPRPPIFVGGIDFGLRGDFVMLLARLQRHAAEPSWQWRLEVLHEYSAQDLTLTRNLEAVAALGWPRPAWVGVDPAGAQRSSQTGLSDIQVLRRHGYRVRARRSRIRDGVERIRARLDHGRLRIAPACAGLVRALGAYHFDPDRPQDPHPVKDGPDHFCDALRYLVVNVEAAAGPLQRRRY